MAVATESDRPALTREAGRFGGYDFMLYAITVFAWSTSWIAVKQQLGVVASDVSLTWRFLLSAALMWAWVLVARLPVRFPLAVHGRFLVLGVTIFSCNFLLMYYASETLPSGLIAVVFSLTAIVTPLFSFLFLKTPISARLAAGGVLGVIGIGLLFWPQIAGTRFDVGALQGLGYAITASVIFSAGSVVSAGMQRAGIPVMSTNAWGMAYGASIMALLAFGRGHVFTIDLSFHYLASLIFLAAISSGLAFWSYLTLIGRIGSARAGYAAVMFPVFALIISTVLENYQWTLFAFAGLALALGGNVLVMRGGSRR
jgi:drug/metabolite transporter (DMT)-like permease